MVGKFKEDWKYLKILIDEANVKRGLMKKIGLDDIYESLNPDVLSESECAKIILTKLHGNNVECPKCKSKANKKQSEVFFLGKRIVCLNCGSFYSGSKNTIFYKRISSYREVYLIMLLLSMGLSAAEVAKKTGRTRQTITTWKKIFNSLESIEVI